MYNNPEVILLKTIGIICEYNPFHNGHIYHIKRIKEMFPESTLIAVMSGNFTQRGSTSIIDKWSKAKSAIECGIDLVIELPVLYSISSAENFAEGAVKIIDSLKVVDYISFGAETADINSLSTIADILSEEPREYKNLLSNELKKGLSYPKARENVVKYKFGNELSNILKSPLL